MAERLAPGCKAESHKMHYLIEYLPFCNRHAANSELQLMTAEPERMPEPDQVAGVGKLSKAEQKALFGDGASDGRTAPKLQPYKDAAVRAARYNHAAFVPVMNGNNPDAKATKDGLIRVPIVTKPFERGTCRRQSGRGRKSRTSVRAWGCASFTMACARWNRICGRCSPCWRSGSWRRRATRRRSTPSSTSRCGRTCSCGS